MREAGITSASRSLPGAFQYKKLEDDYLVTNHFGDWCWLTSGEFKEYVEGTLLADSSTYSKLKSANLLQDGFNRENLIKRMSVWKSFLRFGPTVHGIALDGPDESTLAPETGQRVIDTAFMSTSDRIHLQFSSNNPSATHAMLRELIGYARKKNDIARKEMTVALHTDAQAFTPEFLTWMAAENIQWHLTIALHPALPSPSDALFQQLADYNTVCRTQTDSRSTQGVTVEIRKCTPSFEDVDTIVTKLTHANTTKLWIRPLDPLDALLAGVEYNHNKTLSEGDWGGLLEKMLSAPEGPVEMFSATLMGRVMFHRDNPVTRLRNPAMDGIGSFAYDTLGNVYTSTKGRDLGMMGDSTFEIGSVHRSGYHDLVVHPTVRSIVMATTLEGQPGWSSNAYSAFCGTDPVLNYLSQGSIQGRMPESQHAKWQVQLLDFFFTLLKEDNPDVINTLKRWARLATEPTWPLKG
jgi:uncharacterized protein